MTITNPSIARQPQPFFPPLQGQKGNQTPLGNLPQFGCYRDEVKFGNKNADTEPEDSEKTIEVNPYEKYKNTPFKGVINNDFGAVTSEDTVYNEALRRIKASNDHRVILPREKFINKATSEKAEKLLGDFKKLFDRSWSQWVGVKLTAWIPFMKQGLQKFDEDDSHASLHHEFKKLSEEIEESLSAKLNRDAHYSRLILQNKTSNFNNNVNIRRYSNQAVREAALEIAEKASHFQTDPLLAMCEDIQKEIDLKHYKDEETKSQQKQNSNKWLSRANLTGGGLLAGAGVIKYEVLPKVPVYAGQLATAIAALDLPTKIPAVTAQGVRYIADSGILPRAYENRVPIMAITGAALALWGSKNTLSQGISRLFPKPEKVASKFPDRTEPTQTNQQESFANNNKNKADEKKNLLA